MKLLTKITMKTCGAQPEIKKLVALDGKVQPLLRVFGIAAKTVPGANDYGPFVKIKGQFMATNLQTGEQFRSGTVLLPKVAEELLTGALDSLADDAGGRVEFGFDIGAHFDESVATKYVYDVVPLTQPKESDPLVMLGKSIGVEVPALEAPKAAPAAEPAPASAAEPAPASNKKGKGK